MSHKLSNAVGIFTPICGAIGSYLASLNADDRAVMEWKGRMALMAISAVVAVSAWWYSSAKSRLEIKLMKLREHRLEEEMATDPKVNCLLLEDSHEARTFMKGVLHKMGFEVIPVRDYGEAMEWVNDSDKQIYAALLDVAVPGDGDGVDVARKIRHERPDCHVVIMSGIDSDGDLIKIATADGFAVFQKPIVDNVALANALHGRRHPQVIV